MKHDTAAVKDSVGTMSAQIYGILALEIASLKSLINPYIYMCTEFHSDFHQLLPFF